MKKIRILLALIALFATGASYAQVRIGVKAGINAAKISGTTFDKGFDFNYLAGGFVEIGLGERISINPEVLFSQTMVTRDTINMLSQYKDLYNKNQLKAKLNYLSIPLLLNVKLAGPLHVELGPQYGILINSNKSLLKNGQEAFKSGDFSLIGGVQLKLSHIRISGRYLVGLSNIAVSDALDQKKWKSQAIQASIGYAF